MAVRLFRMRSTAPRCTPATSHSYVHGMSDIAGLYCPREGSSSHICTRPSPRPRLSAPPFYSTRPVIVLTALSASLRRTLPHIFSKSSILCDCVHCPLKLIPRAPPLDPAPAGGFPLRGATPCVVGTAFLLYTPDFTPSPHSSSLLF